MATTIDATNSPDVKVCPECGAEFHLRSSRFRSKFRKQRFCSNACVVRAAVRARDPANRIVSMSIGSCWGLWTITASAGSGDWMVRCDCGTEATVNGASLRRGNSKSCGCRVPEISRALGAATATHGMTGTAEYRAWRSMKTRCHNVAAPNYPDYGGRGIMVCDRWRDSFEAFFADMGLRPSPAHSLDRIDVNGNYEASNCRWATMDVQAANKRTNRIVRLNGVEMTLSQACASTGMSISTVWGRIKRGVPDSELFASVKR